MAQILAFVWAVSAAVCLEAYGEVYAHDKRKPWLAICIGSLVPILNTLIAACFARDKLRSMKR